jgi:hypothetical protein
MELHVVAKLVEGTMSPGERKAEQGSLLVLKVPLSLGGVGAQLLEVVAPSKSDEIFHAVRSEIEVSMAGVVPGEESIAFLEALVVDIDNSLPGAVEVLLVLEVLGVGEFVLLSLVGIQLELLYILVINFSSYLPQSRG